MHERERYRQKDRHRGAETVTQRQTQKLRATERATVVRFIWQPAFHSGILKWKAFHDIHQIAHFVAYRYGFCLLYNTRHWINNLWILGTDVLRTTSQEHKMDFDKCTAPHCCRATQSTSAPPQLDVISNKRQSLTLLTSNQYSRPHILDHSRLSPPISHEQAALTCDFRTL